MRLRLHKRLWPVTCPLDRHPVGVSVIGLYLEGPCQDGDSIELLGNSVRREVSGIFFLKTYMDKANRVSFQIHLLPEKFPAVFISDLFFFAASSFSFISDQIFFIFCPFPLVFMSSKLFSAILMDFSGFRMHLNRSKIGY